MTVVSTAPVVIDDMGLDDIPDVQEIERASFPVPWPANAFRHELTQNRNAKYVVAREDGHAVGYAGLWLMVDEAHITTFAVLPDYRRRKIGERMLQRLYDKYGFRRTGVRRRYYSDNNEDALIMSTERIRERAMRDHLAKLKRELEQRE